MATWKPVCRIFSLFDFVFIVVVYRGKMKNIDIVQMSVYINKENIDLLHIYLCTSANLRSEIY